MREVEKRNANVTVISTEHEAGAKLLSLGGIAALLRFPIYRDTTTTNHNSNPLILLFRTFLHCSCVRTIAVDSAAPSPSP